MEKFNDFLNEQLANNPNLRKEYEALEIEYQLKQALIELRKGNNLTQKELSELTGIHQSDISKLEMELQILLSNYYVALPKQ
ncbi:MAG: XRE family transcriptional regulator [Phascolarctobacterium sp.]|nr:XRE family transcriptional regulator [Phascolarctobacterium sp.]